MFAPIIQEPKATLHCIDGRFSLPGRENIYPTSSFYRNLDKQQPDVMLSLSTPLTISV